MILKSSIVWYIFCEVNSFTGEPCICENGLNRLHSDDGKFKSSLFQFDIPRLFYRVLRQLV